MIGKDEFISEIERKTKQFVDEVISFIGIPDPVKGEVAFFVVLHPGFNKDDLHIKNELLQILSERLGKAFLPREIHLVSDLPKTRSAKIMRRIIRAVYLGQEPGDLSSLENPESLDELKKLRPK